MADGEPTIIRRDDQIIIQPTIVVEPEITMPVDFDPKLEFVLRTSANRRDLILGIIAFALVAGLFV